MPPAGLHDIRSDRRGFHSAYHHHHPFENRNPYVKSLAWVTVLSASARGRAGAVCILRPQYREQAHDDRAATAGACASARAVRQPDPHQGWPEPCRHTSLVTSGARWWVPSLYSGNEVEIFARRPNPFDALEADLTRRPTLHKHTVLYLRGRQRGRSHRYLAGACRRRREGAPYIRPHVGSFHVRSRFLKN